MLINLIYKEIEIERLVVNVLLFNNANGVPLKFYVLTLDSTSNDIVDIESHIFITPILFFDNRTDTRQYRVSIPTMCKLNSFFEFQK